MLIKYTPDVHCAGFSNIEWGGCVGSGSVEDSVSNCCSLVCLFLLRRCHTFGLGSEVCVELVTGIAAASGGQCVLLSEGQRLQTKVGVGLCGNGGRGAVW